MEQLSPPTDLYALGSDNLKSAALKLSLKDIISLCKTSRKLSSICNDIYFWKTYLRVQIPININVPEGVDINWYKNKIEQYPKVKGITDLLDQNEASGEYIQEFNDNWDIFERVENLKELYCSNNQLTSLPSMPNLRIIRCWNDQLTSLPLMPNLQFLSCNDNQLTSLPPMPKLEQLDCVNNQLTSIPLMPNLKFLNCNDNQLTSLPLMPNLEVLYCANNQLTSLPSMRNLRQLFCQHNQLTFLPPMPDLGYLSCTNNPLPGYTLKYWKNIWSSTN